MKIRVPPPPPLHNGSQQTPRYARGKPRRHYQKLNYPTLAHAIFRVSASTVRQQLRARDMVHKVRKSNAREEQGKKISRVHRERHFRDLPSSVPLLDELVLFRAHFSCHVAPLECPS